LIVVDASVLVDVLLRGPAADGIVARWRADPDLHSVHLLDLEVLQVLRRMALAGVIDGDRSVQAVEDFESLRVRRWSHAPLRSRIWDLRANVTAYDAAYLALAERLRCPLLTRDARLAKAPGHEARVEVV
jgi:predicted nucleic acid-binding protein